MTLTIFLLVRDYIFLPSFSCVRYLISSELFIFANYFFSCIIPVPHYEESSKDEPKLEPMRFILCSRIQIDAIT